MKDVERYFLRGIYYIMIINVINILRIFCDWIMFEFNYVKFCVFFLNVRD